MMISMIAAVGRQLELGKNNALLWRLEGDLPFFKRVTMGKTVIMGRRTYESMGRALPGRRNIVITRDGSFSVPDALHRMPDAVLPGYPVYFPTQNWLNTASSSFSSA